MQFQTKSYYGFIDTLPASRKKIVKKLLDQQLNIAGILTNMHGIYRYADFIVLALKKADCILKVSVITHGMRMTSRGKEYGEFLNPKTEYKLYTSPNEYFSLNKTY